MASLLIGSVQQPLVLPFTFPDDLLQRLRRELKARPRSSAGTSALVGTRASKAISDAFLAFFACLLSSAYFNVANWIVKEKGILFCPSGRGFVWAG